MGVGSKPVRFAVLASHQASSFQRIYANLRERSDLSWVLALTDDTNAPLLDFAQANDVTAVSVECAGRTRREYSTELFEVAQTHQVALILMIGFKRIIGEPMLSHYHQRMVNLHPSLLPRHAGLFDLKVHQQVLDDGDRLTGPTLHWVTAQIDHGPIIRQSQCDVSPSDSIGSLKQKVQQLESELLLNFLTKDICRVLP